MAAIDVTGIEAEIEAVLDEAIGVIPGNPGILLGVERKLLHLILVSVVTLIAKKIDAIPAPVVSVTATASTVDPAATKPAA